MFCSNCGSKLPEGARFCSTCGTRVADVFEVPAVESKPADTGFVAKTQTVKADEPYEAPLKKRVTFDWSNVIDEPQKKVVPDIKSPWATTGSLDRKELYEEMKPSGERSRTMSFIDVLKAEKEEMAQSSPQAEKPIEYTEVLDPGYLAGETVPAKEPEQAPVLHFAPLYDDVDEPVVTPFDIPEEEKEPEAPAAVETPAPFVSEIGIEVPAEEPALEEAAAEEPVQEETVTFVPSPEDAPAEELAAEPIEPENRLGGWFDLPDFLKPKEVKPEETVSVSAEEFNIPEVVEEPVFEEPEYEEAEAEESEVVFEEPAAEPEAVFEEPAPAPEVVIEEPAPAPEIEIPEPEAEEEVIFEADFSGSAEDEYLDIDTGRIPDFSRATASFTMPETEEEAEEEPEAEAQEAEADEPLAEEELFEEMEESAPVHTGMTIAAPADKESEIEALKKRLAELMGTSWEEPAPAPVAEEEPEAVEEPVFEEPEFEETEPEVVFEEPAPEPEAVFEEPAPEPEVVFVEPVAEPEEAFEEPAAEPEIEIPEPEAEEEVIFEADFSGSTEDEYLDIDTGRIPDFSRATASFTMPEEEEAEEETEAEAEPEPETDVQETEADEPVSEEELFEEMEASAPVHTGMTIAAPADKESEIEALKKRLAELMGTSWEEPAAAPAAEVEPEEPAEEPEVVIPEPEIAAEEPEAVISEPEFVAEEPAAAAEESQVNIEDAYLYYDDLALTPDVSEPVHEMPEIVFDEPEVDYGTLDGEIPEIELIDEEEGVLSEPELIDEYLIIPEPELDSYEPELVTPEPEVALEEPEVVISEPEVIAEEPEIVMPEPEVAIEEPEIVIPEPEVIAEEPEEEPVKTIDDFLAAILEEGAAEAPVQAPAEVVIPEPEVAIEEPEIVIPEPEVALEEPEIVIPEPEVAIEEPEIVIPEPEAAVEEPEEVLGAVLTDEELGISIPEFTEAAPAEAEAAVEETATEEKETDALSLEDLEKDLFGVSSSPQAEVEATKKIDKFYTLYRKNEEFQRLLDEEYNKLKAAGGPTPEPAIPEPEEPVPAKKIEDATIYQDFDLEKEAAKLREQQAEAEAEDAEKAAAMSAAEVSGAVSAAAPAAAAAAAGAAILTADKDDLEIEEVEKGGGCLTVLAVVIAILLIILLGVILVLNFMPDSAIAFKIDSIIENITSHFTAVDVMGKQFLL